MLASSSHLSLNPDLISGDPSYFNRFAGHTGDWLLNRQTNCFLRLLCNVLNIQDISLQLSFNDGHAELIGSSLREYQRIQAVVGRNSEVKGIRGKEAVAAAKTEENHLVANGTSISTGEAEKSSASLSDPLKPLDGISILDVGGNHGQVAVPLGLLGAKVTVVQSEGIGKNSQIYRFIETFSRFHPDLASKILIEEVPNLGDLTKINSTAYDVVTCFRILPHIKDPQVFVQTLMGKSKLATIIEYPNLQSINVLSSLMFELKKRIEKDTRPFVLFRNQDFRGSQFSFEATNQCSLPLALHRYLGKPKLSEFLESLFAKLRITRVFGSPTIAAMQRQ